MQVRLLGELELLGGDAAVPIGAAKERVLLAILALSANSVVPEHAIADALWGGAPPPTATRTLRAYVSRLRRALTEAAANSAHGAEVAIESTPGGYRLRATSGAIDVACVEDLVRQGRAALEADDVAAAEAAWRDALSHWNGPPLAEFATEPWAAAEAARLAELRLAVLEDWIDAQLRLGRHEEVGAELEGHCAEHPMRERLWALWIVALARSGRQAEALRVYGTLRAMLRDDLGIDPSPALQDLERRVLQQDPDLSWASAMHAPPAAVPASAALTGVGPTDSGGAGPMPNGLDPAGRGVFVGRGPELEVLDAAWMLARSGTPQAVLLGGEPGIGKSRLVAQFAQRCHEDGAQVLFGACDEDLGVPYQPFAEALRPFVARAPLDLLRRHVVRHGGELSRLVPELAAQLGDVPSPLAAEPETERFRLFDAVAGVLSDAAELQRVVLVLDDLQWATKPTLLLLRHMLRSLAPGPVLIVGLYRDTELSSELAETLADLRRLAGVSRLTLRGFDEGDVVAFLEAGGQTSLDDAGREFARRLQVETGGSPFFVNEVVRHLAESGVVARRVDDGSWSAGVPGHMLELPASIREVIARRLGRLSPDAQTVLGAASVIGAAFSVSLLDQLDLGIERDAMADALDEALDSGMVRLGASGSRVPGADYVFAHDLVRRALYDRTGVLKRARLHRRIAESLETAGHAALGEIASHFLAGAADGVSDKAVEYALRAASEAVARVAYEEAVHFAEHALEVLQWTSAGDTERACDVLLRLADCQWRGGDVLPSRETYHRAAEIARRLGDAERLAAAALRNNADLGGYTRNMACDPALVSLLEEALAAVGPGDSKLRAQLLARLAVELFYTPELERRTALGEEAVAMAQRLGDDAVLLFTRHCQQWAVIGPDVPLDDRLAAVDEILELADRLGDRETSYQARFLRLLVHLDVGDFAAAEAEAAEGRRLAEELRLPAYLPWVDAYHALQAWVGGDLDRARELNGSALSEALTTRSDPDTVFAVIGGQGVVFGLERPEIQTAAGLLDAMVGQFPDVAAVKVARVFCNALIGDKERATPLFEELLAPGVRAVPRDSTWGITLAMMAMACERLGDTAAAADLYDVLSELPDRWASTVTMTLGPFQRVLGFLARMTGRLDVAVDHLERAIVQCAAVPAPLFLAECWYDAAAARQERGVGDDAEVAARYLAQCLEVTERLGLSLLAERAQTLRR